MKNSKNPLILGGSLNFHSDLGIAIILHYRRILIFSAEIDHFRKIKKNPKFYQLKKLPEFVCKTPLEINNLMAL